jgi:hypothetical protein
MILSAPGLAFIEAPLFMVLLLSMENGSRLCGNALRFLFYEFREFFCEIPSLRE